MPTWQRLFLDNENYSGFNLTKYMTMIKALFSSSWKPKCFQDSLSYRILWHMHETLNIDENKN